MSPENEKLIGGNVKARGDVKESDWRHQVGTNQICKQIKFILNVFSENSQVWQAERQAVHSDDGWPFISEKKER